MFDINILKKLKKYIILKKIVSPQKKKKINSEQQI